MKKILNLIIVICICSVLINPFQINGIEEEKIELAENSFSACLIEASTMQLIYEKQSNVKHAPASMTKIMTLILIMEKIKEGSLKLDDYVTTPTEATKIGGSRIFLDTNEKMKVEDLIKAIAIASANDAAYTMGVHIAGSEKLFVEMMNKKSKQLQLENTNFVNSYGYDDDNHYSSSYDIAIMSAYLINNFPSILKYTSTYEDYVREDTTDRFWLVNTNKLVRFMDGVDGLKTGYTEKSKYCLSCTYLKDGVRYIAVSMGAKTIDDRTKDIKTMLLYASSNYELKTIIPKGTIVKEINDVLQYPHQYKIVTKDDVKILLKRGSQIPNVETKINNQLLDIYINNELYTSVDLVTNEVVKKSSFLDIIVEVFKEIFLMS